MNAHYTLIECHSIIVNWMAFAEYKKLFKNPFNFFSLMHDYDQEVYSFVNTPYL